MYHKVIFMSEFSWSMNYIFSAYISQNKSTLLQIKIINNVNQNLDFSLSELKIIFVPSSSTRILWPLEEQRILAQVKHDQNGDTSHTSLHFPWRAAMRLEIL